MIALLGEKATQGVNQQADIRAALVHLEGQVINLACDDIGRHISCRVLLPMICDCLEAKFDEAVCQRRAAVQRAVNFLVYPTKCFVELLSQSTIACAVSV